MGNKTNFAPLWLTTDEQLDRFQRSLANASLMTKLLGTYPLPEGTAHLRGVLIPWARVPVVIVSAGEATLAGSRFSYSPRPFRAFGWSARGLQDRLAFEVDLRGATVDPADFQSPFARMFNMPFTRVRTGQAGVAGNFLVCIGGRLSMSRIRSRSLELRAALVAAAADHGIPPAGVGVANPEGP